MHLGGLGRPTTGPGSWRSIWSATRAGTTTATLLLADRDRHRDRLDRVSVPDGTERMVRVIAERSASLGAGVLHGATMIEMGSPTSASSAVRRCTGRARRPCTSIAGDTGPGWRSRCGSAEVVGHAVDTDGARAVEASLAHLSIDNAYPYVLQNELALMEMAAGSRESSHKSMPALRKLYGLDDLTLEELERFVQANMRSYFDVEEWVAEMARFDLVIGSRFHGCVAALLAGVPAKAGTT